MKSAIKTGFLAVVFALLSFGAHADHNGDEGSKERPVVISGQVIDSADGQVLTGVTLTIDGTSIETQTDEDGRFQIEVLPSSVSELTFSFVSFETLSLPFDANQPELVIAMTEH